MLQCYASLRYLNCRRTKIHCFQIKFKVLCRETQRFCHLSDSWELHLKVQLDYSSNPYHRQRNSWWPWHYLELGDPGKLKVGINVYHGELQIMIDTWPSRCALSSFDDCFQLRMYTCYWLNVKCLNICFPDGGTVVEPLGGKALVEEVSPKGGSWD